MAKKKTSRNTPSKKTAKSKASAETVLVLRTCAADMSAHGGFKWPESGPVECPDWDPAPRCGGGLHGCVWGEGYGDLLSWDESAKWLVVEVEASAIVELDGKVKFPRGVVVHCGTRLSATEFIQRPGRAVIGGTATAGYAGTATAGARGTATAGDEGTATAGARGTATAGDEGTATAGDAGTATAGYAGTATAGARGTATAGYAGTATAGDEGIVGVRYHDGKRYRLAVGYVGEDGIEPGVQYVVADGKLVRKSP